MKVTYFQRKPLPGANSIERIFRDVRGALPSGIKYTVSVSRYHSKGILPRLYNMLEAASRQADVNHITGDIHYAAYFLKKQKTLLTIHDCVSLESYRGIRKKVMWFLWYWLPQKRSALIVAISESTKMELLKHSCCDPNKIRVVYDCVSPSFRPVPYSFNVAKPVILQVGTTQNKNLIRIAQALEGIPCRLNIIGLLTRPQMEALRYYSVDYSNHSDLSDDEMVRSYIDCDMVIFASTYEGFGLPIVEANATGRPIVTSNVLSMPEVAGDAACLVNPFDVQSIREGILRVIQNADYREQIIQNGFENVKRFQPDAITAQYVSLYEELASRR
jgi:glycosyltransferase involved in cell wall biosynthesis